MPTPTVAKRKSIHVNWRPISAEGGVPLQAVHDSWDAGGLSSMMRSLHRKLWSIFLISVASSDHPAAGRHTARCR